MPPKDTLVAVTGGRSLPLGNIWLVKSKRTDFYLEPLDGGRDVHLSAHGRNDRHPDGHRFHVKVDHKRAATAHIRGVFAAHEIPTDGYPVDGLEIESGVFLVARVRWSAQILSERYSGFTELAFPPVKDSQHAVAVSRPVDDGEAIDMDLVISFGEPYWPGGDQSARDNARIGPFRNSAGMTLTGTLIRRREDKYPTPSGIVIYEPQAGEEPNRIMAGAPGDSDPADCYWFIEGVTGRQVVESSQRAWVESLQSRGR